MNEGIIIRLQSEKAELRKQLAQLQGQISELGRQNIALAAEAERAAIAEQQLATADERIKELEVALLLAKLPPDSRDNVIQMVLETA